MRLIHDAKPCLPQPEGYPPCMGKSVDCDVLAKVDQQPCVDHGLPRLELPRSSPRLRRSLALIMLMSSSCSSGPNRCDTGPVDYPFYQAPKGYNGTLGKPEFHRRAVGDLFDSADHFGSLLAVYSIDDRVTGHRLFAVTWDKSLRSPIFAPTNSRRVLSGWIVQSPVNCGAISFNGAMRITDFGEERK